MKRFVFLLLTFSVALISFAGEITEAEALQKAQQFMQGKQFVAASVNNARRAGSMSQSETNIGYYIFNAKYNGGFVIVSADDRMPEILGYSNHGCIDIEAAPCGLKWLLGAYEQMAKTVSEQNVQLSHRTNRTDKAPIAPFITTTWGQSTPYNAMCPRANGARCLTGCVATAMAQIMNYYRWPNEVTKPIPAYITQIHKISMPQLEPTTFTWGHMNKNQLSKLMLYCGQAVKMEYGPKVSGAGAPDEALKTFFDYDENLRFVNRDDTPVEDWDDMLYEELAAQRPVYYCGYDSESGHAFVLCGFQEDHYYINWGWDGDADGYFILDGLSPAVGAYNLYQGAVIGIKPKGEPTPISYYPRRIVMENNANTYMGESVIGEESVKRLTEDYPDHFIGIQTYSANYSLNGAENYTYMLQKYSCYPNCYLNRSTSISPYYKDLKNLVEMQKDKAYADINATATFAKPDKSAITVTAESIFGFSSFDEDFRLAFVLLEDNVGPYTQDNSFYSNPSAPDDPTDWMNEWVHKAPQVEMMFNNVARGIYGDALGIAGSLPATIEKGKTYHYEYSFNVPIPPYSNITCNKDNFRVVALLIDKSTGEIMNACQTKIGYDANIEKLGFEFENKSKKLANSEIVVWKSKGMAEDNLEISTYQKTDGLKLRTFNGQQASGTSKLEILNNTLGNPVITWGMGGTPETISGDTKEMSFTTGANGIADIQLKASGISQFGELEARITATVNEASQSVIVKFVHSQTDGLTGDNIQLNDGEAWWANASSYAEWRQGTEKEERYHAATHIPSNLFGDKVPTIDGIGFWGTTSGMANVTLWISSHLPAAGEEPDIACFSFPEDEMILEEWNYMVFRQQYQIPEQGVYVGYSFDIVDMNTFRSGKPVLFGEKTRDNAFWFRTESMPEWIDRFDDTQGNLSLQILYGGNVQKKNAVKIFRVEPTYALTNSEAKVHFQITNEGSEPLSYIEYDGDFGHHRMDIYLPPYASSNPEYFPGLEFNTDDEATYTHKKLTVSKVNGKENESEEGSAMVPVFVSRKESPSVAVLEEFTATWCGYSPAASLDIKSYQETFGEKLITICAHAKCESHPEPMDLPAYSDVRELSDGEYPTFVINRTGTPAGYAWTIGNDLAKYINLALEEKIPCALELGAAWDNDQRDAIKIHTRTTFELNASELPFLLGYVLLEDSLSGEGAEWAQQNAYSGIEDIYDKKLEELTKLPPLIYGYKYNNVPVAAWDAYKGVEGSLVGPYTAGQTIEGTFRADIGGSTLIQNKDNLSVVALIVNKETGKIINAAKCKIGDTLPPADITSLRVVNKSYDVYDMQGRRVNHPSKGLYIMNGKKYVVK